MGRNKFSWTIARDLLHNASAAELRMNNNRQRATTTTRTAVRLGLFPPESLLGTSSPPTPSPMPHTFPTPRLLSLLLSFEKPLLWEPSRLFLVSSLIPPQYKSTMLFRVRRFASNATEFLLQNPNVPLRRPLCIICTFARENASYVRIDVFV